MLKHSWKNWKVLARGAHAGGEGAAAGGAGQREVSKRNFRLDRRRFVYLRHAGLLSPTLAISARQSGGNYLVQSRPSPRETTFRCFPMPHQSRARDGICFFTVMLSPFEHALYVDTRSAFHVDDNINSKYGVCATTHVLPVRRVHHRCLPLPQISREAAGAQEKTRNKAPLVSLGVANNRTPLCVASNEECIC